MTKKMNDKQRKAMFAKLKKFNVQNDIKFSREFKNKEDANLHRIRLATITKPENLNRLKLRKINKKFVVVISQEK